MCWCALSLGLGGAATAAKKKAKKGGSKTSTVSKPKTGTKSSSTAKTAKKGPSKRGSKGSASTWRTRQMAPTSERYKEIQEALASKGYLKQENATGVWSQDSVDALKKFQQDQKIDATGKINSLSLIALGLGPKRDASVAVKAPDSGPVPPVR